MVVWISKLLYKRKDHLVQPKVLATDYLYIACKKMKNLLIMTTSINWALFPGLDGAHIREVLLYTLKLDFHCLYRLISTQNFGLDFVPFHFV
jgi:hypothetical protein